MEIEIKHLKDENLTSKEVEKFNINPYNREVKENALLKTIKTIYNPKTHKWCQVSPIQVNVVTNNIIDGQHRWYGFLSKVKDGSISQDSTIPVHFVRIPKEQELTYIQTINRCKAWTTEDYVKSQIAEGNENSKKLLDFCEEHELCYTVKKNGNKSCNLRAGAAILTGGRKEMSLKKGDFIFPEENRLLAETVHTELVEILSIFPTWTKGKANIEAMVKAWYDVRNRYSFSDWKKAFKNKDNRRGPMTMSSTAANSWKQYFAQCAGTIALGEAK